MLTISDELKDKLRTLGLTKSEILVCEKLLVFARLDEVANNMNLTLSAIKGHLCEIYWKLGSQNKSINKHALLLFLFKELLDQQKTQSDKHAAYIKNTLPVGRVKA